MAQRVENRPIDDAVELLKDNGFEGLAEAVTVLLNTAMVAERSEYLGAAPYERSASRVGYANGFKDKTIRTRLGELSLKVPQTRDSEFYPQSLEKGLRNVRPGRVDPAGEEDCRRALWDGCELHPGVSSRS